MGNSLRIASVIYKVNRFDPGEIFTFKTNLSDDEIFDVMTEYKSKRYPSKLETFILYIAAQSNRGYKAERIS